MFDFDEPGRPLFFIGSSPSMAGRILSPDYPAAGVMISVVQLRARISEFKVSDWIMDSGAFSEVARLGGYRTPVESYFRQIELWKACGNLLAAVSQDYMCEPFVLERTGLTVSEHQRLTIDRYDQLLGLKPSVPIMPVIQGYRVPDYLDHLDLYGERLSPGAWVGVGSVCRRNGRPQEVLDILRAIANKRPDLRLHGFGLKAAALELDQIRKLLYSCDSMAWSYPLRFRAPGDCVRNELGLARDYQVKIATVKERVRKVPRTAGAGNGQGRKPSWRNSPTMAIRVPTKFAPRLLELARTWDNEEGKGRD